MSDAPSRAPGWKFELTGGRLCLDFVNTVTGMRGVSPTERLPGYPELVEFARQSGALDDLRARRLLAEARRRPADAAAALRGAAELREALYRILLARVRGVAAAGADLERLSHALGASLSHRRLERRGDGIALTWEDSPALDAPLWPIVASAGELLASRDELERVRVCGLFDTEECSWIFLDESRAGTRRWCSMKDCGNRAKARRHHRKVKAERA